MFQSEHFLCSNQNNSCVPISAFLVFQSQHFCPLTTFWATKRLTDLEICPSEAKNLEEADFDVQKSLARPKSVENYEKPKKNPKKNFNKKIFGVKKSKVANRPKRVLPKFRGDQSHVRRGRGRLGGIREA